MADDLSPAVRNAMARFHGKRAELAARDALALLDEAAKLREGGHIEAQQLERRARELLRAALGVAGTPIDGDELRRLLAGVGVVGNIDGYPVIRRSSVLELVNRRISEAQAVPGVKVPRG